MPQSIVLRISWVFVFLSVLAQAQIPTSTTSGLAADTQKIEPATISGRVVRSVDGTPLKKATVMATITQTGQTGPVRPRTAVTDADGKFLLKDVDPGRYSLTATHSGYTLQFYGERVPHGPVTVSVVAGQQLKDVVFRMIPAGVIAGRIVDEDGEPVFQARVEAQRWMYMSSKRRLIPRGIAVTNDLGEYRISQLDAGRYVVSATYQNPMMWNMPVSSPDIHEGYSQIYYPGVYDSAQAEPLEVKGGAEIGGINFRMVPAHAVHIRGVVKGALGANVELVPKGTGFGRSGRIAMPDDKGAFEIAGVMPGTYTVSAISVGDEKQMYARQIIDVADTDIDDVYLALKPGADIPGKLRMEGHVPTKDSHIQVGLSSDDPSPFGNGMPATPDDDMTFTLKGVADGDYRLTIMGLPEDTYVKSAYVGTHNILEEGFHLASPVKPMEITISTNGARIEGTVTDSKNTAFTGAQVVIVPAEPHRKGQELFKAAGTDQYGRFSLHGIVPGTYTIYAWESLDEVAFMDPDFLKMYADAGKSVRVSESSSVTVDLKVIPVATATADGN